MTCDEIRDEREFYQAVMEYTNMIWQWGVRVGFEDDRDPTPDELIEILNERIEWVNSHKKAVDRYLRKRAGPTWVRVIDGSNAGSAG